MMNFLNVLGRKAYVAVILLLLGVLVFLFLQTRAVNFSASNEIVDTLRDLKQVDAEWNVDVLRAKTGLALNYDQVASPLPLIARLEEQLQTTTEKYWLGHGESISAVQPILGRFRDLMSEKIAAIEQFKSQNAILRNSSRFLPVAATDLTNATRSADSAMPTEARQSVERVLNGLLANAMSYTQNPDPQLRDDVLKSAEALQGLTQPHAGLIRESADILVNHVKTMLRQQDRGADLLAEISSFPTANVIDELSDAHTQENSKLLEKLQAYQRALMVYSAGLLALLVFAGVKLLRNYQLLNRANEDLSKANKDLKESQVQLIQSEKMSALGQMVAGIAHEINTPLAYIKSTFNVMRDQLNPLHQLATEGMGFSQAMRAPVRDNVLLNQHFKRLESAAVDVSENGLFEELKNNMDDGKHGLEQISEIVQNLKNFSRLDREKVTDFSVEAGLESTLLLAKNLLKNSVEVRRDFAGVPEISGSPSQVNQVFLNLITNAVHAMPERTEPNIITLRTSLTPEGDMVQVEVQDNGKGIAPEVLPQIFDPFFTTKPIGQGTGMGLSISYKIIEEHGGKILVESEQGLGTVFTILLPMQRKATPAEETASPEVVTRAVLFED